MATTAAVIIGDDTWIEPSTMDGTYARGLVPRDLRSFPMGSFAPVKDIPLVDLTELPDRIRESEEKKTRLMDIILRGNYGQPIPSLDQNDPKYMSTKHPRWGYCWMHGPVGAAEALRARMGLPFVRLSAFGMAYTMKDRKDEGGWAAQALEKIKDGIGPEEHWPRFEQKLRPPDHPFWTEAPKYAVTEGWMELASPVYDRDMSYHQMLSLLINRVPVCCDRMWWSHSTYSVAVWDAYPNRDPKDLTRYGIWDRNSWGDQYGERGFFRLKDTKARADNSVAPSVVMAA